MTISDYAGSFDQSYIADAFISVKEKNVSKETSVGFTFDFFLQLI